MGFANDCIDLIGLVSISVSAATLGLSALSFAKNPKAHIIMKFFNSLKTLPAALK